jgi:hypothetical protein
VESWSGASPVAGCVLSHPVWRSSSVSSAAEAPWPMALRASSPCCSELLMQFRDKLTLMRGVAALVWSPSASKEIRRAPYWFPHANLSDLLRLRVIAPALWVTPFNQQHFFIIDFCR